MTAAPWEQDWGATEPAAPAAAASSGGGMPWEQDWARGPSAFQPSGDVGWDRTRAFGYGAADAATIGFGDEISGALAGAGAVLSGQDYGLAYRQRVDEARARLEEARQLHPISTLAGSFAGAGATFLVPGLGEAAGARLGATGLRQVGTAGRFLTEGRFLPYAGALERMSAGRGAGALLAQGARGAGMGAAYGAAYGAGAADGGDRVAGAQAGALWGGALGGVAPAVFQGLGRVGQVIYQNPALRGSAGGAIGGTVGYFQPADTPEERQQNALRGAAFGAGAGLAARPALSAVRQAWRNPRQAFGEGAGASIGIPPISGGAAPPPRGPEIEPGVARGIDRLLGRENYGVDEFERRVVAAGDEPLGRTVADIGGQQFLAKADALANLPGQTGPRAAALAEARAQALANQITDDLQTNLGVRLSPTQAQRIIDDGLSLNGTGYEAVTAQMPVAGVIERRINPMMRDPTFQEALERLYRSENRRMMLAELDQVRPPPRNVIKGDDGLYRLSNNASGDTLHRLKMAFDAAIGAGRRRADPSSIEKFEASELTSGPNSLRERLLRSLDEALPGYTKTRLVAGGLHEAEDALEQGSKLLNLRPQEIEEIMSRGSEFERRHMQIAAADDLIERVMKAGTAEGSDRLRNAANPLANPELRGRVRAIFDDPSLADRFLRRLNERDRLMRNSQKWFTNSSSVQRGAQAGDQFLDAAVAGAGHAATGNPIGAAGHMGRAGINALRGMAFERENNALGSALLRSVERGNADDEAYVRALLARLREMEAGRASRARESAVQGGLGAIGGGSYTDHGY